MLKKLEAVRIMIVMAVTIAAEVLLSIWSQQLSYEGRALNPSVEPALSWALLVLALVTVIAMVGPKHERIWLIAVVFVVATVVGIFIVGQFILSIYAYRRDYTYRPSELHSRQLALNAISVQHPGEAPISTLTDA